MVLWRKILVVGRSSRHRGGHCGGKFVRRILIMSFGFMWGFQTLWDTETEGHKRIEWQVWITDASCYNYRMHGNRETWHAHLLLYNPVVLIILTLDWARLWIHYVHFAEWLHRTGGRLVHVCIYVRQQLCHKSTTNTAILYHWRTHHCHQSGCTKEYTDCMSNCKSD